MSLKEALGFGSDKKVRYAIVGLGDIAQEDMMPGVEHTGNSEMTALVTSDATKASELADKYSIPRANTYTYEQFAEALASGSFDAIYLATPNWRHAEFIIPALQAGIHVLCEKPMEVSTAKCTEILDAERASTAKLMIAYRLHFEPATLDTISKIREGVIGEVHTFSSAFAQNIDPANHRAYSGTLAGPLFDMGPYPVNAVRYLFNGEPTAVLSATALRHPEAGLGEDVNDSIAVTLAFPRNRIAQFTLSYWGGPFNSLVVIGSKGSITLDPSYVFGKPLEQTVAVGEDKSKKSFKNTDHFGGELKYFSDCILNNKQVEPDGEEGFADVRVLEGILQAIESGGSVQLPPFTRTRRIDPETQLQTLSAVSSPDLVNASNPGRGVEKQPKN